jgi:outer membrane protein OmpA-like peptidoglycan-associated protein
MPSARTTHVLRRTGAASAAAAAGAVVLGLLAGAPTAQAAQTPVPRFVDAQMVGYQNAFLTNGYVEVGVRADGTFGSTVEAPAGYHPRGEYNATLGGPDRKLGLRADRDKDGWGVGNDDGDFILPGSPYENWGLQVAGHPAFFSPDKGTNILGGMTTQAHGGEARVTFYAGNEWHGVGMAQTTTLPAGADKLETQVAFINTTNQPIPNVYYARIIDADNCATTEAAPCSGSYDTTNTVRQQKSSGDPVSAVSASAADGSYLELRTDADSIAAVTSAPWNTLTTLESVYANPAGFALKTAKDTSVTGDRFIYLLARTGPIPANGVATITFTYLLSAAEAGVDVPTTTTTPAPTPTVTETTTAPPVTTTVTETATTTVTETTTAPPVTTTVTATTTAPPVTTTVPTTVTETSTVPTTVTATVPTTTTAPPVTTTVTPPATAPAAPGNVVAKGGDQRATVTFGVPGSGGSPITGYQYRLGSSAWTTASTSVTGNGTRSFGVSGLRNGTTYRAQVRAVNAVGASTPSGSSAVFVNSPAPQVTVPRDAVEVPSRPRSYQGPRAYTEARWSSHKGTDAPSITRLHDHQLVKGEAATLSKEAVFASGSAELTRAGRAEVKQLAKLLKVVTAVRCEGYTDYAGKEGTNDRLGTLRARAVCKALKSYGADVEITLKNDEGSRPVVIGGKAESRDENRRVVVVATAGHR